MIHFKNTYTRPRGRIFTHQIAAKIQYTEVVFIVSYSVFQTLQETAISGMRLATASILAALTPTNKAPTRPGVL